ncbi:ninja-family protein AFP3-like [Tasmannia lanceolata]|uniref:ninja-family protein AFP3-like n=1 Tax=Tasmannia lanceolata TaxID=3420 RepID=UPI004064C7BD
MPGWADRRVGNYALKTGFPPSSQAPVTSQGSSSSGVSDFENRSVQGLSGCTDAKSPASDQSLPEHIEQKAAIGVAPSGKRSGKAVAGEEVENPCKKVKIENGVVEMGRNVMEEMPCVSTRGGGPNGTKIEGFLYRYRNGEEVRIVCVCHGSFLTPAEFVKHAGGGDVAHPLRHIVVTPSPSLL